MNFCEKCNLLTELSVCPLCGGQSVREAAAEDYCFFVSLSAMHAEMFESALGEKGIEAVSVPYYPRGVTYLNAGRAEARHIYLRYRNLEAARNVYEVLFGKTGETI